MGSSPSSVVSLPSPWPAWLELPPPALILGAGWLFASSVSGFFTLLIFSLMSLKQALNLSEIELLFSQAVFMPELLAVSAESCWLPDLTCLNCEADGPELFDTCGSFLKSSGLNESFTIAVG